MSVITKTNTSSATKTVVSIALLGALSAAAAGLVVSQNLNFVNKTTPVVFGQATQGMFKTVTTKTPATTTTLPTEVTDLYPQLVKSVSSTNHFSKDAKPEIKLAAAQLTDDLTLEQSAKLTGPDQVEQPKIESDYTLQHNTADDTVIGTDLLHGVEFIQRGNGVTLQPMVLGNPELGDWSANLAFNQGTEPGKAELTKSAQDSSQVKRSYGNISVQYDYSEQGWKDTYTVTASPTATIPDPLTITVDLDITGLKATLVENEVRFTDELSDQPVFSYGKLKATDANGTTLPAEMVLEDQKIVLKVDDTKAVYPVTVDPTMALDTQLEDDYSNAYYGYSVASAGDVNGDGYADMIAGAPYYTNGEYQEGAAYVYYGSATGVSTTADWEKESDTVGTYFGYSVASAGDVNADGYDDVIIGARGYRNALIHQGAAFVYYGSATGLSTAPDWTGEGSQTEGYFGYSVASAGDVNGDGYDDVIIGAYNTTPIGANAGDTYVYYSSASGLSTTADWHVTGTSLYSSFGGSVASAGDVNGDGYDDVIIGDNQYSNGASNAGAAFVYYGSATGLSTVADWEEIGTSYSSFGSSVASAGDVNGDGYDDVIIGAQDYENGQSQEGAAYVYYGSASGLPTTADWEEESDAVGAAFGYSVASAGDVNADGYDDVIVGAANYENGEYQEGGAFVYYGSATGPSTTADGQEEGNQIGAVFGNSVASAGDVNGDGFGEVIVGAYKYDNGQSNEGAIFLYSLCTPGVTDTTQVVTTAGQAESQLGTSATNVGDVNGDGYEDIVVGSPQYSNGNTNEGAIFAHYGSLAGLFYTAPDWSAEGNLDNAFFGTSLAGGDVNNDGYSDVAVGALLYSNGQLYEGAVALYYGSSTGLSTTPDWLKEGNQMIGAYGASVSLGDVNGDTIDDLIVGQPLYSNGQRFEGALYVYHGSTTGLPARANIRIESNRLGTNLGFALDATGDINNDTINDILAGAPNYTNGQLKEGAVFLYTGSTTGVDATSDWQVEGDQPQAKFGTSVTAISGTLNDDTIDDVLIGSPYYDTSLGNAGKAYVYYGIDTTTPATTADWTMEGTAEEAQFGYSVSSAGVYEGYTGILIGAPYTNSTTETGTITVYHGPDLTEAFTTTGDQFGSAFGLDVSTIDFNHDSYGDILVGAPYYDVTATNEGMVSLLTVGCN